MKRQYSKSKRQNRGLAIHKQSCWRKKRFRDEYPALKAMANLKKSSNYDGGDLKVYECSCCGGWHVGHAKEEE